MNPTSPNVKNLAILGATGSIGRSTLDVVARHPDRFKVRALTAKTNIELLARQVTRFQPRLAVVFDEKAAAQLKQLLPAHSETVVSHGETGYLDAATLDRTDTVVGAMVGAAGLKPTLAAIEAQKTIALANKETLVMAGEVVMARAAAKGVPIIPIDSEHSAIFQCLNGNRKADVGKIFLTASGGPFRTLSADRFDRITKADALDHPNWDMGAKITIDSATMMNKGLEVIEAHWLFDTPLECIEVVVHPQSIVHSMVGYADGSIMAQLGVPDMRGAIAYALSFPDRLETGLDFPDFFNLGQLTFEAPDLDKFTCLALAFRAAETGGTLPAVLNAANEVAVNGFLEEKISFRQLPQIVCAVMDSHAVVRQPDLDRILAADQWARAAAADKVAASA